MLLTLIFLVVDSLLIIIIQLTKILTQLFFGKLLPLTKYIKQKFTLVHYEFLLMLASYMFPNLFFVKFCLHLFNQQKSFQQLLY